jgi:Flp pilus assembly protein TadD
MIRRWLRGCLLPSALCLSAVGCTTSLESLTGGLVAGPAPAAAPAGEQTARTGDLSASDTVRLCLDAGREMDKAGKDDGALEQYERVLTLDPNNFTAMRRLCVLYDRQARWDRAEAMYKTVAKARPKDADIWSDWGYSFFLRAGDKNWAEAEVKLRHALELYPQHARAHSNLGLVLGHLKRYPEAFAEFRAAQLSEAEAHCDMAFVYWSQGKMDEAKHECRVARDTDSSCLKARDMLTALEKGPPPAAAGKTEWSGKKPRASTLSAAQWQAEHEAARRAVGSSSTGAAPAPADVKPWQEPGPITMPSGTRWMPVKSGAASPTPAPAAPPSGGNSGTVTFE